MNHISPRVCADVRRRTRRVTGVVVSTACLLTLCALPAAGRQDPGESTPRPADSPVCGIQRVEVQYVACDNLTGNNVPAPSSVDER